jgi:hypothetical protein
MAVVWWWYGLPFTLLWVIVAVARLVAIRNWSLASLTFVAILLPIGGGIGTPIHALFALILACFVTALTWPRLETALSSVDARYVAALVLVAVGASLAVRRGVDVPVLNVVAQPLLAERERTFQLERALAWLRSSEYCDLAVEFAERADNPIDSVESAIRRQNRPPASLSDVRLFWNTVLKCDSSAQGTRWHAAVITFGSPLMGAARVFDVDGRYGGPATVWIAGSR